MPNPGRFDRLSSTLFVAVLAHGIVILGVTFAPEPRKEQPDLPTLNVTLLVDAADAEADARNAEFLASRTQAGGGDDDSMRPTRVLTASNPLNQAGEPLGADAIDAEALEQGPPPDQLVSPADSDRQVEAVPETTDHAAPVPMMSAALLQQTAPETLAAEVDDQVADASDDDSAINGPSTRESAVAAYMVGWRQRVEQIGTANFPTELLTGNDSIGHPIVEVSIRPDGTLNEVVLRRSSGDTRLDQAAMRILELAGPFAPLPEAMLAEFDVLRFSYEWDFAAGGRVPTRVR